MDFVIHLPRTPQGHDAVWVIVDRLTNSAHFLAVRMTFTLERFYRLYIWEIVRLHGVLVSIVSDGDPRFTVHFWKSFQKGYGHTIDHEYNFPPADKWSVREDHTGVRGHVASMRPGS